MSTIKVDTVQSTGGSTVALTGIMTAKYFVHYVQATPAINKSLNSSSVTDASTGHFTLNYTSAFDDANYGLNSGLGQNTDDADSDRGGHSIGFENGGTVNTTSAQLNYLYGASQSSASVDNDTISFHTLYGDLA
tara:strand:+ start:77 stop:478 length:402 start_codon:yes stop_codon:yes gene_type:complete